ncbi:MAG: antibiotic biosynthesis monooxygenase [Deltaproteobacteria bacterium]|nr:antibiotic biosynthesis monooxygenase [Deltaproteobacteria bacterium]
MIELHMHVEVYTGKEEKFENLYWNEYVPAISIQEGFRRTTLIKKRNALREYQIDIEFESEELRENWVASSEHEEVIPKVFALCSRFFWFGFDTIEKPE